jgi:hypothetical protein
MQRHARGPRASWVVSARTKRPTGYGDAELAPGFDENAHVITTGEELTQWLAEHRGPRRVPRPRPASEG